MITDPAASRPGTHLDPDQLADLFEGLLDPAAADLARTHLATCRLCSADFALIAGEGSDDLYGAGLAELLPPTPIPQDVVARIEAALHREPPLGTAQPSSSHAVAAARPRRRRFRLALGSLAGATLVVVGGIGVLTATNGGGSTESKGSSSAANGAAPNTQNGGDSHLGGGSQESPALGAPHTASSGGSFGALSIEKQAEELLGQRGESPASGTGQAGKVQCTPDIVPAGTRPIASTLTSYQGRPAWLLLYAEPGSSKIVDVYVVDRDSCGSDNLGHVDYQTTVTRP